MTINKDSVMKNTHDQWILVLTDHIINETIVSFSSNSGMHIFRRSERYNTWRPLLLLILLPPLLPFLVIVTEFYVTLLVSYLA